MSRSSVSGLQPLRTKKSWFAQYRAISLFVSVCSFARRVLQLFGGSSGASSPCRLDGIGTGEIFGMLVLAYRLILHRRCLLCVGTKPVNDVLQFVNKDARTVRVEVRINRYQVKTRFRLPTRARNPSIPVGHATGCRSRRTSLINALESMSDACARVSSARARTQHPESSSNPKMRRIFYTPPGSFRITTVKEKSV